MLEHLYAPLLDSLDFLVTRSGDRRVGLYHIREMDYDAAVERMIPPDFCEV